MKRKRQSNNELKQYLEELLSKLDKRISNHEERIANQEKQITVLITDLKSSRHNTRAISYCQMLDTYLNIIKFAKEDEPVRKKQRNSRRVMELREEARRYSTILDDHKRKGDALDPQETKFLDVFSKIDQLCAVGVGNLRL